MEPDVFLKRLRENKKPITLFLGAGINPAEIPKWNDLIDSLLDIALARLLTDFQYSMNVKDIREWIKKMNFTVYEQGNFIIQGLGTDYIDCMYDALYSQFLDQRSTAKLFSIDKIVEMCLTRRIDSVVTYNYDNLLEEQLRKSGFKKKVHPIYGSRIRYPKQRNNLPIYHVHGYIPLNTLAVSDLENEIVLGLNEYHQLSYETSIWQFTTQLHFLQNHFCIFLGTSLTDMNMLRLISFANNYSLNRDVYIIKGMLGNEIPRDIHHEIYRLHFDFLEINAVSINVKNSEFMEVIDFYKLMIKELKHGL